MVKKPAPSTKVITEDFKTQEPEAVKSLIKPDVKHVQFHAGIDAMGSSLSVSNKQADLFLELNGVRILGKTEKNKGKKFFVPFTNIRGVTLL